MVAPELLKTNKTTPVNRFLSLTGLDERILKLETLTKTIEVQLSVISEDLNDILKLVQQLTEKHNSHLKFGHKEK